LEKTGKTFSVFSVFFGLRRFFDKNWENFFSFPWTLFFFKKTGKTSFSQYFKFFQFSWDPFDKKNWENFFSTPQPPPEKVYKLYNMASANHSTDNRRHNNMQRSRKNRKTFHPYPDWQSHPLADTLPYKPQGRKLMIFSECYQTFHHNLNFFRDFAIPTTTIGSDCCPLFIDYFSSTWLSLLLRRP
jgi:hypothetical protein